MTSVTQCPQCGTRFRVVPDQLKISNGWVRCGKCGEVFNAQGALETAAALQAGQPAPVHTGTAPQQVSIVLRQQEPATVAHTDSPAVHAPSDGTASPGASIADRSLAAHSEQTSVSFDGIEPDTPSRSNDDQAHAPTHSHSQEPEPDHSAQPSVVAEPQREGLLAATQVLPRWLIRPDRVQRADIELAATDEAEVVPVDPMTTEPPQPVPDGAPPLVPVAVAVSALQQTVAGWVRSEASASPIVSATHLAEAGVSGTPVSAQPAFAAPQALAESVEAVQLPMSAPPMDIELSADPLMQAMPGTDPDLSGSVGTPTLATSNRDTEPQADVGFIRQARRQAAWASGPARAALGALIMFSAALLLLQVAVQERDRLAAFAPALKPWLVQLCEPIGCEIALFQHIEAVEIVSTELVRAKDGTYRFELGLRNNGVFPVAMPAVELSLTDRTGDAVVRRVVLPDDWGDAPTELPPISEMGLTLKMSLVNPDELRMEGFRAVVFYP